MHIETPPPATARQRRRAAVPPATKVRSAPQPGDGLPRPSGSVGGRVLWWYLAGLIFYHLVALLALVPWLFSWTGVFAALAGLYVFGTLGINLCFHRLLTHRSFTCPLWLEHFFALLGVCCLQDSPARWVTAHRMHHQHSDDEPDPHSPLVAFLWGHVGWLLVENRSVQSLAAYDRYARDLLRDPFYLRFERNLLWIWVNIVQWGVFFLVGLGLGWLMGGTLVAALQMGASLLVWGVFVRTVAVWHITWSVNSLSHVWGYRNYETGENSRNNWFVALISNGEGWHNNHHADQRSAAHGQRWWELDVTYLTIRALAMVGLVQDCVLPRGRVAATCGDVVDAVESLPID